MRVLHLAPSATTGTGIATYASRFRGSLVGAGVDVDVLTDPGGAPGSLGHALATRRAARSAASRYDVVHAELGGGGVSEFYAALGVADRGDSALVLTLHDPPRLIWSPFQFGFVREFRATRGFVDVSLSAPAMRLEKRLLERSAGVFVLTNAAREVVASRTRTDVAILPFTVAQRGAGQPESREAQPSASGGLLVGYFGYWYPGKGIELLIRAIARTRDDPQPIRVLLWGQPLRADGRRAGERYRRRVLAEVRSAGLMDRVEVGGYLDDPEVPSQLSRCAAVVLPYEVSARRRALVSTSAAMYEALACSVPVVAANARAMSETVIDGVNGLLFPAGDVEALAAQLRRLRDDDGLRARLRRGAAATAEALLVESSGSVARRCYERWVRARATARGGIMRPDGGPEGP